MSASATGAVREKGRAPRGRQSPALWVALLALVSFGLVMWRIDARSIWWDESLSLYRAQHDLAYILSNRIDFPGLATRDQHPPLYFLLLHLFVRIGGESDLVLRMPSALAAITLVPLLYVTGRRLKSVRVGLLSALLGALSPLYLWYGQEARMYTLVAVLALLASYCLWRDLDSSAWTWRVGFVAAVAAGIGTHYLFVLVLPAYLLLVLVLQRRSSIKRGWMSRRRVILATVILIAVMGAAYMVLGLVGPLRDERDYVPLRIILVDVINSFSLGLSVNIRHVWPLDVIFGSVFALGLACTYMRTRRESASTARSAAVSGLVLIPGLALLPPLLMWALSAVAPLYRNSRYAMVGSTAYYLGMALGLDAILRWRRWVGATLLGVIVAGMLFSVGRYQVLDRYQRKEAYRDVSEFVAENERVGDVIVVVGPESVPAFAHYYDGPLPVRGLPEGGWSRERLLQELEAITQSYDRVWLVHGRVQISDPDEVVSAWFEEHTLQLMHRGYPSSGAYLAVEARLPRPPLQDLSSSGMPHGSWADTLSLLDYGVRYFDVNGMANRIGPERPAAAASASQPVPAGKLVSVEVYVHVLGSLPQYKVSLRLIRDGVIWAQRDREPFMAYPSTQWPVGGIIRWETDVQVPPGTPPGAYDLGLVLYRAADGSPIPFAADGSSEMQATLTLGHIPVTWPQDTPSADEALLPGMELLPWPPRFAGLELRAHLLSPPVVRPGEGVWLQPLWHVRHRPEVDYRLIVNWQSADGTVWHSSAHSLCGCDLGTSAWPRDAWVRGMLLLEVPEDAPPGVHSLHLLVYDPTREDFVPLGRGPVPWLGSDWAVGRVEVQPSPSR